MIDILGRVNTAMGANYETGLDDLEELLNPDGEDNEMSNEAGDDVNTKKAPKRKA